MPHNRWRFLLVGLVSSGQLWPALAFIRQHPQALTSMLLLSAAASVGKHAHHLYIHSQNAALSSKIRLGFFLKVNNTV